MKFQRNPVEEKPISRVGTKSNELGVIAHQYLCTLYTCTGHMHNLTTDNFHTIDFMCDKPIVLCKLLYFLNYFSIILSQYMCQDKFNV